MKILSFFLFFGAILDLLDPDQDPQFVCGSSICMRIRIQIQQPKLMRIHADPDTDSDPKPWLINNNNL
jgi:hypothetical protein